VALKILLADDSMTAQNMGKKILTEAGYDIIAVSNGAAALKKIAELKPDIAILDVFMPGYTGPEVCERIKNVHETSKIPVLLTVGKMEMSAFKPEETNRVKADGLIIKPFEATDLIALIQKLEKKLVPAKPLPTAFEGEDDTPAYEKTVKLDLREFRDASYDEWKTTAEEHTDEDVPKKPAPLSSEMASSPAFMDSMDGAQPAQRTTQVLEKGQTVTLESSTIQLPPPNPVASASSVPDWAMPTTEPAADVSPVEEIPAATAEEAEAPSRETGVGKLLSKAKTWFGGGAAEGEDQPADPAHETVATSLKGDTKAMDPADMAPPPPEFAAAATPDWAAAPVMEMQAAPVIEAASELPVAEVPFEPAAAFEPHVEEASAHHSLEIEHTMAPQGMDIAPAIDPALDTSMHRESHADVSVSIDPALDTSMHRDGSEVASAGVDPALVTDPTEMASAFPTNFGVAGATIDPVGIAADVPGLYDNDHIDAAPAEVGAEFVPPVAEAGSEPVAEEPVSGWRAEEHHLENHEHGIRLEHEMAKHYAAQASIAESDAAAPPSEVTPIIPAAGAQTNAPDMQFAAAMAAAVGAEMPAGLGDGTTAMDPEMLARIVQRVTERMRPSLIAEITKELLIEQQKDKK
jgi:CheY-like chemotaxis protein